MRQYVIDAQTGDSAVKAFCDVLDYLGIKYRHATKEEQDKGIDILTNKNTYEIKNQTYADKIIIEEADGLRAGWIHTITADYLIEVAKNKKSFLQISVPQLKQWYADNKQKYQLISNEGTKGIWGQVWTVGCFVRVPLIDLKNIETKIYIVVRSNNEQANAKRIK